jgi:tetratricopeptide (TPR) repeat protein
MWKQIIIPPGMPLADLERDTFYLASEFEEILGEGTLHEFIDRLPPGRKYKTAMMLQGVNKEINKATEKISYIINYFRVKRLGPAFQHFRKTVESIGDYIYYYVIVEDEDEFQHFDWTNEVLTAARQEVQTLLESITDFENVRRGKENDKSLRSYLSEAIEHFDQALNIIEIFTTIDTKLQAIYGISTDLQTAKYNFANCYAQIANNAETFSAFSSLGEPLKRKCDWAFTEVKKALGEFTEELARVYESQAHASSEIINIADDTDDDNSSL